MLRSWVERQTLHNDVAHRRFLSKVSRPLLSKWNHDTTFQDVVNTNCLKWHFTGAVCVFSAFTLWFPWKSCLSFIDTHIVCRTLLQSQVAVTWRCPNFCVRNCGMETTETKKANDKQLFIFCLFSSMKRSYILFFLSPCAEYCSRIKEEGTGKVPQGLKTVQTSYNSARHDIDYWP